MVVLTSSPITPWSQCLGAEGLRISSLPEAVSTIIFSVSMVSQGHQLALVISSCLSGCLVTSQEVPLCSSLAAIHYVNYQPGTGQRTPRAAPHSALGSAGSLEAE